MTRCQVAIDGRVSEVGLVGKDANDGVEFPMALVVMIGMILT